MAYISKVTTTDNNEYDIKSKVTAAIPYGECDSTSTATAFTATVDGITSLYDGVTVMLRNGVVTSASGFTININGLGAKPVYNNMATGNPVTPTTPTRDTTIFNINYTMLLVYDSNIVSGGGWICYRGYDGNTNTIGYQVRTNSGNLPSSDAGAKYRLWLTSADGTKWVPINTSTSTNATTARTLNTRPIDPFGPIVYNSTNGSVTSGSRPPVATLWQQYTLTIGYSYVLSMTAWKPVYLQATPQTDGSAVMNALTQTLPSSKDGKIYIYLGLAYSATAMELRTEHPVYWHDGTGIRIWSGSEPSGGSSVDPSTATPLMDGTAAVGVSTEYARGDHRHPSDTAKVDAVSSYSGFTGRITNTDASAKLQSSTSGIISTVEATGALAKMNAQNLSENTSASVTLAYGEVRIQSTDGTYISNVQTPTANGDAANKQYVDNAVASAGLPSVTTSDNDKVLTVVNGAWAAATPSGGSVSYTTTTATLTVAGWSNNAQTVSVSAVTATSDIIIAAAPASISDYASAGIYCSAQAAGSLTFTCSTTPTAAITVNLMIFEGGNSIVRYSIAKTGAKASSVYIMDSSSVTGAIISEVSDGETVYINSTDGAVGTVTAVRDDTGASLTLTSVTPSEYVIAYSFVMPPSPVTVTCPARGKD